MKRLSRIPILLTAIIVLTGCQEKHSTPQEDAAPSLYADVVRTLKTYTDSISKAKDSLTVKRITEKLSEDLTSVNFNQPANTDWSLTEDENDTIYALTTRFMCLRESKLKELSADSIPADSLKSAIQDRDMTSGSSPVKSTSSNLN